MALFIQLCVNESEFLRLWPMLDLVPKRLNTVFGSTSTVRMPSLKYWQTRYSIRVCFIYVNAFTIIVLFCWWICQQLNRQVVQWIKSWDQIVFGKTKVFQCIFWAFVLFIDYDGVFCAFITNPVVCCFGFSTAGGSWGWDIWVWRSP